LFSPLLSLALLGGIAVQNHSHLKPRDVEPYHERAKAAIEGFPYTVGRWSGSDQNVPPEAVKLLRPNAKIISRTYIDCNRLDRDVSLLLVQCRDPRDMAGHYPPNCYPGQGEQLVNATPQDWRAGDMVIPGTLYQFQGRTQDRVFERYVFNFMIVPGLPIIRSMDGIYRAAEDYQNRYYGAAQVQLVMPPDLSDAERRQIFDELIGPNTWIIRTLLEKTEGPHDAR
jgi:hypothetical protein